MKTLRNIGIILTMLGAILAVISIGIVLKVITGLGLVAENAIILSSGLSMVIGLIMVLYASTQMDRNKEGK